MKQEEKNNVVVTQNINNIRNFAIIAHIDHGKTTLSDCLIKKCNAVNEKQMRNQFLDNLEVERKRGITIKAQTICLSYLYQGQWYELNLIDTPGHVDFYYEVSRAMKACEGAVLVVDATQGVEAQTLTNAQYAKQADLRIIPAFNKVDLPTSDPKATEEQVADLLDIYEDPILVSAKSGEGVEQLIEAIITQIPAPLGDINKPLKALLVDSWYDQYFGVVLLVRIIDGVMKKNMQVDFLARNKTYQVDQIGIITGLGQQEKDHLYAGQIGYMIVNIKTLADCYIGDTICEHHKPVQALEGFKKNLPIVFCGVFPADRDDHMLLSKSLERLGLNDSSFSFEPIQSPALGMGFRCGFLGMLHMDIIMQRLENEFDVIAVITTPSVSYQVFLKNGSMVQIDNPTQMPEMNQVDYIKEPMVKATVFVPHDHLGSVIQLCTERGGIQEQSQILGLRTMLVYRMPLREIIFDFYDSLKSLTHGYASFDYELTDYQESDIVPLQILINGSQVDALSCMVHKERADRRGREICTKLKENLDRQNVQIAIQAAIGAKIIARETLSPYRKDVTAKLYGGDRTRKDKLLEKQKKGKKKMRELSSGNVRISQKAIYSVLGFKGAD